MKFFYPKIPPAIKIELRLCLGIVMLFYLFYFKPKLSSTKDNVNIERVFFFIVAALCFIIYLFIYLAFIQLELLRLLSNYGRKNFWELGSRA